MQINTKNKELTITTSGGADNKETTIDTKGWDQKMLHHVLNARYIEGYDNISIYHDKNQRFTDIPAHYLGMIIESHSEEHTVLKSTIKVPEDTFQSLLRRSAHILLELARMLESKIAKKTTDAEIKEQEFLLDYNLRYCLRYLNKYEQTERAYKYFLLCATLESAGDYIRKIAQHNKDKKLARIIIHGMEEYTNNLFRNDVKNTYKSLREFRLQIPQNTFVEGIAQSLAENLYNFVAYLAETNPTAP